MRSHPQSGRSDLEARKTVPVGYEATKKWRKAHPEEARRIGRQNNWNRSRREGKPIRGKRTPYSETKQAKKEKKEALVKTFNLRMK